MRGIFFVIVLCLFILSLPACMSHDKASVKKQVIGTDSIEARLVLMTDSLEMPVAFNVLPGQKQRVFITDNSGTIRVMKKDSLLPVPFLDLRSKQVKTDKSSPVGHINSVAFHPDFASNGKFFVCYSGVSNNRSYPGKLVIASFSVSKSDNDMADPLSETTVMELEGKNIIANGAMIGFGPDGYLYISVGDDAIGDSNYVYHAQDLDHLNGKILRIDVNTIPYGIPADNPFVSHKHARPEIFAYGFRKMWRFCFEPSTKKMFGGDVGELQEEEIDMVEKGGNYGWPVKEGDSNFQKMNGAVRSAFISPVCSYPRNVGICVIGGNFYSGNELPVLKGRYLFSDFNGSMFSLQADPDGKYQRQCIKILNKPAQPFFITGSGVDGNNEVVITGFLVVEGKNKGVVYRVIKG